MEHQRVAKPVQKEWSKTPSSSLHQTSLKHAAVPSLLEPHRSMGNQVAPNLHHSQDTRRDASAKVFRGSHAGRESTAQLGPIIRLSSAVLATSFGTLFV